MKLNSNQDRSNGLPMGASHSLLYTGSLINVDQDNFRKRYNFRISLLFRSKHFQESCTGNSLKLVIFRYSQALSVSFFSESSELMAVQALAIPLARRVFRKYRQHAARKRRLAKAARKGGHPPALCAGCKKRLPARASDPERLKATSRPRFLRRGQNDQ